MTLFVSFIANLFAHVCGIIDALLTWVGLVEKVRNKPCNFPLKWLPIACVVLLFACSFLVWRDQHRNSANLSVEIQTRHAQIVDLRGRLDDRDHQILWLQQHQITQILAPQPDPVFARAAELDAKALHALSNRELSRLANLKKDTVRIASAVLELAAETNAKLNFPRDLPMASENTPAEMSRKWKAEMARIEGIHNAIVQEALSTYLRDDAPTVLAVLQRARDAGETLTGVRDADLKGAFYYCDRPMSSAAMEWCATHVAAIGATMR